MVKRTFQSRHYYLLQQNLNPTRTFCLVTLGKYFKRLAQRVHGQVKDREIIKCINN